MALRSQSCQLLRLRSRTHAPQCLFRTPNGRSAIRYVSSTSAQNSKLDIEEKSSIVHNPLDPVAQHRLETSRRAYYQRRIRWSIAGLLFGMAGLLVTAMQVDLSSKDAKMDSGPIPPSDPMSNMGRERPVLVQKRIEEETGDQVPTGTSTIPTFPRIVEFADIEGEDWKREGLLEYQLLGCGVRKVSFLGIEVYVVGIYVATDDIATLQQRLIRKIDPIATTLVTGEKENLKRSLLDGGKSEEIWNEVLRDGGVRSLVRIVPCKNTDFHHMRDAWVRALKARAQKSPDEYGDEAFGQSVQEFKSILTGGTVPKGREMLLGRGKKGELCIWYDNGKEARRVGGVGDERVSRAVWLNYLGGQTVASELARASVVDGVMEFVERPVGTVATQVHV